VLRSLHLRDFVIIAEATIQLCEGFTVFTGETGAGKSLLIDALGLLVGERADPAVIRPGCKRAELSAEFELAHDPSMHRLLEELGLDDEPGKLILRRTLEADGRSRSFVNGRPTTVQQLRQLGERLIDTHGQHAALSLMGAEAQREWLDRHGKHGELLNTCRSAYQHWVTCRRQREQAEANDAQRAAELASMRWILEALESLRPRAGEWQDLSDEQRRLANGEKLREAMREAIDRLIEADDALATMLRRTLSRLENLLALDHRLSEPVTLIEGAVIQLEEAAEALKRLFGTADDDLQRLAVVEDRMGRYHEVARKLRIPPQSLEEHYHATQPRVFELERLSDRAALVKEEEAALAQLEIAVLALRRQRHAAGHDLAARVNPFLQELGMPKARLTVRLDAVEPSAHGADRVVLLFEPHAGAEARPLGKVASGGELSRLGLAIATAAAHASPTPTLIFDEADSGVGGAVAQAVGDMMRELGRSRQVMCVTHLPQVASRAHQHLRVSKLERDGITTSAVEPLDDHARVEEIARMLGGREITEITLQHARELIEAP
jgi:DNA repair protein RecN (Recombination protein N)